MCPWAGDLCQDLWTLTRSGLRGKSTSRKLRWPRKAWKTPPPSGDDEKWLVRKEFTRATHLPGGNAPDCSEGCDVEGQLRGLELMRGSNASGARQADGELAASQNLMEGVAVARISFGRCLKETRALQKNEDVYKLTAEMRNYVTWCPCTLSGLRNLVKIGEVLTRCSAYLDLAQVSPCWVQLMLKLLASRLLAGFLVGCTFGTAETASPELQAYRLFSSDQTLAALILLSALKGADVQLLPSSFRAMEHELHMRPHLLGLMALAQGVACAVTGPIWGNLVDSGASRKLLLKVGTGLWGLCTFQLAFTTQLWPMLALRVLNGAALSMLLPVLQSFISDLSTSDDAGQICGKVYCAANFGQVLACLIVVPISEHRIFGVMGWRICLAVVGILSLLVVLLVEAAVEDLPRTWDPKRFGLMREFHKLAKFLRLGSFRVIILQGVFGTIPGAAQTFTTMYFQYLSISNHMCGLIIAMRTVGEGIGGALGGYLGDAANAKNHRYGRTWVAMFSVTASIPFLYVVYMGIPREASLSLLFAGILFTMGLVTTWEVPGCLQPVVMDIIPRRDLSSAFSWDVAIVFASGNTIGPLLVGFIAQDIFDYHYTSEKVENMSLEVREHNASALGRAIFFSCVVPSLISAVNFSLLFWTYPADKESLEEREAMEDEDAAERTVLLQKESRLERSWETRNGATANAFTDAQHCVEGVGSGGGAEFAEVVLSACGLGTNPLSRHWAQADEGRTPQFPGASLGRAVSCEPVAMVSRGIAVLEEESPGFYVLTFEDLSLEVVHERFLFWSQDTPATIYPLFVLHGVSGCHKNIPLSAICGQCHVDRFSMSYLRAPKKRVFHNIIQALSSHGPMTSQQLEARLRAEGHPLSTPKALMAKLKLLQRSSKASKGSNSILHLDKENRFHVTETGQQFWSRQHHWHQKRVQEKVTSMKIQARTELEYMDATSTQAQAELEETWKEVRAGDDANGPRSDRPQFAKEARRSGAMSPLQAWLACTSRAEESVAHGLGRVAKSCARNPWKCVAVTVVGCLLCALGVLRFTAVSEARDLWVDQGSQVMKDLEWTEKYFTTAGRVNRVLVTAKDGGNILRPETMAEIFRMADDVKALSDADGKSFADVCLRVSSGCLNAGIRRYFGTGTSADFNQTVQSQADILVAVNKANFPDGAPAFADDSMGGIARDGSGSITSSTAARVDFILDAADEAMMKWEEALVRHFTKDQLTEQGYEHVNAFVQAERSQDDELNRTVQADIPLFAIAFVLMASFCSIFLGKTASWTQSRRLLGAVEFYLVIFGCIAGYGTCMLIGVPFTVLQ
ncbi:NPC1L1, partial [Symbiodinium microadriaticum]